MCADGADDCEVVGREAKSRGIVASKTWPAVDRLLSEFKDGGIHIYSIAQSRVGLDCQESGRGLEMNRSISASTFARGRV